MSGGRTGRVRTRVRFGETDAAGVVFYGTYLAWFDVGTSDLIRLPGVESVEPDGKPAHPLPLVEIGARFFAPLRFDDEIDIVSSVARIGSTSLRIEHEILFLDGSVAARGFEQRVFVRIVGRSFVPHPIPDALRLHLTEPGERA